MKKKVSVEAALIKGLEDARDFEWGKKVLKIHKVKLPSPAPNSSDRKVKRLRQDT